MNKESLAAIKHVLHAFLIIFGLQNFNHIESFGI